ncbi:tetratricopeptide repeat protein [Sphingomonas sp.]|uniref:tetratricopeptide repeat protein n=1 Tax=Sphingomonas sp. TaxID=28214 RepID=UPI00286D2330|nr:tetratricopeptide repeat protein [Sphingomonas sp.]
MGKSLRLGTALTAVGMIGTLTGCATTNAHIASRSSIFGDKIDKSNIGIATRAQAALDAGDFATAVSLAERAVGNTPNDAGFRALLGGAYFGAGRFASAESAYRDSLSLMGNQPQVVLKLALVTIAQGKNDEAMAVLEASRGMLDPADYGLALALAGQPQAAVAALDAAARETGADSRVRQNLALAHALSGNWEQAKLVAAQDIPADQVDARVQQWMTFAKPAKASDQVASLTGINPAASDPGQPVRLALVQPKSDVRMAEAEPVAVVPVVAEPALPMIEEVAVAPEPVAAADIVPVAEVAITPIEVAASPVVAVEQVRAMVAAVAAPKAKRVASKNIAKPGLSPRAASFNDSRLPVRRASFAIASGSSKSVVQLGAYASQANVAAAWNKVAAKYPSLRGYKPGTARFDGPRGTVYRLSVSGFASQGHAQNLCSALKTRGGACFVRSVAGERPVRMASL